ncbi:hypothetical protein PCE1_003132 [Barthelona sp. PCE]
MPEPEVEAEVTAEVLEDAFYFEDIEPEQKSEDSDQYHEDDYYEDEDDYEAGSGGAGSGNALKIESTVSQELERQFGARLNVSALGRGAKKRKDKAQRATVDNVLDQRTRLMIYKMMQRGLFDRLDGCVSTGKEANVYRGVSPSRGDVALKVYKTSILEFKDRDQYVTGEFRFRQGYSKGNPRQMVALWAEKEYRNLSRLQNGYIPSPRPLFVQKHVLGIEFLGEESMAAPRLKDVDFVSITKSVLPQDHTQKDLQKALKKLIRRLYIDLLMCVRAMWFSCHLVHADLSEFNILFHNSQLYIIDVSQSVEHEHPNAFEFLRKDIHNVNAFFRSKLSFPVLSDIDTFFFITLSHADLISLVLPSKVTDVPSETEEPQDSAAINNKSARFLLKKMLKQRQKDIKSGNIETEMEEEIWRQVYIPFSLWELDAQDEFNGGSNSIQPLHVLQEDWFNTVVESMKLHTLEPDAEEVARIRRLERRRVTKLNRENTDESMRELKRQKKEERRLKRSEKEETDRTNRLDIKNQIGENTTAPDWDDKNLSNADKKRLRKEHKKKIKALQKQRRQNKACSKKEKQQKLKNSRRTK